MVCPSPTPFASLRDVPPNEPTYFDAIPKEEFCHVLTHLDKLVLPDVALGAFRGGLWSRRGGNRTAHARPGSPWPIRSSATLTDEDDYNGWLRASRTVEVRSRVRGHIQKIHFKDGDMVQKGQLALRTRSAPVPGRHQPKPRPGQGHRGAEGGRGERRRAVSEADPQPMQWPKRTWRKSRPTRSPMTPESRQDGGSRATQARPGVLADHRPHRRQDQQGESRPKATSSTPAEAIRC